MNEELKVKITAEIDKLKSSLKQARDEISKTFDSHFKKATEEMDETMTKAGEGITNAAKTIGVGIAAVGTALIGTAAATEEYREQQAKLTTAFESAGSGAEQAKNTYNDLYRVLGDSGQATEAASHLALLTTNEKELSEWTTICQGVYATFGDSLPIEGLTEAANETAKVGTVTGGLADALNWAGISEEEFNEKLAKCNDEAEREKLIRDTLNGVYADAAATYEENNAQVLAQRDAQAKLQDTLAQVGEAIAPVITAFTTFATDALAVIVPYIQQLAEQYMPLLQEALSKAAEVTGTIVGFIVDNWDVISFLAGIIAGIAAAVGLYNAVAAVKAAMAAAEVTTVWALVSAYAAQAAAMFVAIMPYIAIVAAIAAVIAIIILCIKYWDEIKEFVAKVWDAMKAKISEIAENISNTIKEFVDGVKNKFEEMKTKVAEKIEALKTAVKEKFEAIKNSIQEKINSAKEKVISAFENIKNGIKEKIESAKTAVTTTFENIKSTIKNKVEAAKTTVLNIFGNIKNGIKEKIDGAKDAVKTAIDKIKSFFDFKWELPKIKLPKISIKGEFSLSPPSVPKFSISWNKLGGVFDKPTLFGYGGSLQGIGEDGAEAVVPLERNTQWMNKLANMLSERMALQPIVMNVDGKTFAQISVDSINALTKQTGNLGLKLI